MGRHPYVLIDRPSDNSVEINLMDALEKKEIRADQVDKVEIKDQDTLAGKYISKVRKAASKAIAKRLTWFDIAIRLTIAQQKFNTLSYFITCSLSCASGSILSSSAEFESVRSSRSSFSSIWIRSTLSYTPQAATCTFWLIFCSGSLLSRDCSFSSNL